MSETATSDPVSQIPSPAEVRERLAITLREARLLRSLLRVSQKAEDVRRRERDAANAGEATEDAS